MTNSLINRELKDAIAGAFQYLPVVTLTGPRQSGKTTLCRMMFPDMPYVNLEDMSVRTAMEDDPKGFLSRYPEGVIIDEAQNFPDIFSYIQVEVDNDRFNGRNRRFIVTGSNNFSIMQKSSQSMAGRTAVMSLLPLSTSEILNYRADASTSEMILRGGYPAVWKTDMEGKRFLMSNYYNTYVERDVRSLINIKDLRAFQVFIRLAAGRIGQEFNANSLSVEVGVSVPTIKNWLSILQASYLVYLLQPYYSNLGKRLTKTPKLYFYDTGLACFLMGINTVEQLDVHPLRGNLFENMVINDVFKHGTNQGRNYQLCFYRDRSKREVDLLRVTDGGAIEGYEIKSGKTYKKDFFRNLDYLKTVLGDKLVKRQVIYDGDESDQKAVDGYCNFRELTL